MVKTFSNKDKYLFLKLEKEWLADGIKAAKKGFYKEDNRTYINGGVEIRFEQPDSYVYSISNLKKGKQLIEDLQYLAKDCTVPAKRKCPALRLNLKCKVELKSLRVELFWIPEY